MDPAYVKFMMCQCLLNRADWGLAVACLNVLYSIFLFLFWLVELIKSLDNYPVKWVLLYGFNIMFNVITMMRIVKRESISVFYWACGTGALLLFRIYHIYYVKDVFPLAGCQAYMISNQILDAYILLSLVVMVYVMWGLHREPDRMFPKEDMVNDYVYNPEPTDQNVEQLYEELEDKRLEMIREMIKGKETKAEIDHIDEVENCTEMDDLNSKVILKLAGIKEEETASSPSPSPIPSLHCEPTAPEVMDSCSLKFCPEPTAPSESHLSFDDVFCC
ncbi:hypothetical protein KR059_012676, partial [Drosophila kikkawai]